MELKRYFLAILGGFLGGFIIIAGIILLKLYSPINFPLISFFLAPFINKGYRLLKGRVNRRLPKIIVVISILNLIILYLILYPLITGSIANVFDLSYWKLISKDVILSLIGAIVGIYKTYEDILYEIGLRY